MSCKFQHLKAHIPVVCTNFYLRLRMNSRSVFLMLLVSILYIFSIFTIVLYCVREGTSKMCFRLIRQSASNMHLELQQTKLIPWSLKIPFPGMTRQLVIQPIALVLCCIVTIYLYIAYFCTVSSSGTCSDFDVQYSPDINGVFLHFPGL